MTEVDYGPALRADYEARCSIWSDIVDWLPTLHETVLRYPQATVLELGVRSGNSTATFLYAVDAMEGQVTSADIHRPTVPGWWWNYPRWTCLVGDDCDPAVMADLPTEVDVLFIDTSHHYEHTLNELKLHVPRVKPGGTVLMHDTELDYPDGYNGAPFPVARALDAYCAEAGLSWENHTGCYGLGIIKVV